MYSVCSVIQTHSLSETNIYLNNMSFQVLAKNFTGILVLCGKIIVSDRCHLFALSDV